MKQYISEVKRMQQLAGLINKSQLNESLNFISNDSLNSMVKTNSLVMILDNIIAAVSEVRGIDERAAMKLIDDALDRIESGDTGSDVNLNPKRSSFYN